MTNLLLTQTSYLRRRHFSSSLDHTQASHNCHSFYLCFFCIFLSVFLFIGCVTAAEPTVDTLDASCITTNSAVLNGDLLKNGGYDVIDTGFFYGTSRSNLDTKASYKAMKDEKGAFNVLIMDLEPDTDYYYQAYAVNDIWDENRRGVALGSTLSFTTSGPDIPGEFEITSPEYDDVLAADTGVILRWTASSGAVGYRFSLRDLTNDDLLYDNYDRGNKRSCLISADELIPGNRYRLAVCAYISDTSFRWIDDCYFSVAERESTGPEINSLDISPDSGKAGNYYTFTITTNKYTQKVGVEIDGNSIGTVEQYTTRSGEHIFSLDYFIGTPGESRRVVAYAYDGTNKLSDSSASKYLTITSSTSAGVPTIQYPESTTIHLTGTALTTKWKSPVGKSADHYNIYLYYNDDQVFAVSGYPSDTYEIPGTYFSAEGSYSFHVYACKYDHQQDKPAIVDFIVSDDIPETTTSASDLTKHMLSLKGKTGSELQYTTQWCAYFIGDSAKAIGLEKVIPTYGNTGSLISWFVGNGDTVVCFPYPNVNKEFPKEKVQSILKKSNKLPKLLEENQRISFEPQVGDIIGVLWDTGIHDHTISHVEVIYEIDGNTIKSVSGNTGSVSTTIPKSERHLHRKVDVHTFNWNTGRSSGNSGTIVAYARPNYAETDPVQLPTLNIPVITSPSTGMTSYLGQDVTVTWQTSGVKPTSYTVQLFCEGEFYDAWTTTSPSLIIPHASLWKVGDYSVDIYPYREGYDQNTYSHVFFTVENPVGDFSIVNPSDSMTVDAGSDLIVSWTASSGANGYQISLRNLDTDVKPEKYNNTDIGNVLAYTIPARDLTAGNAYRVAIGATSPLSGYVHWIEREFSISEIDPVSPPTATVTPKTTATASPNFAGGSGTEKDPYLIATPGALNLVRYELAAHYRLIDDIDLRGYSWEPIGTPNAKFTGTFDGYGHFIQNLTIEKPASDGVGLFGYMDSTKISDLSLINANVTGKSTVGGIAGEINSGLIVNCSLESCEITGVDNIGGIVGGGSGSLSGAHIAHSIICGTGSYVGAVSGRASLWDGINNSVVFDCRITGKDYVGGVAGRASPIKLCSVVNSEISGNSYVGGIASSGSVEKCVVQNSIIQGTANVIGGIVGNSGDYMVIDSYTQETHVSGKDNVGGITGYANYNSVSNCSISDGRVTGSNNVGGISGGGGSINTCFILNTTVSGTGNYVGGISSKRQSTFDAFDCSITNSFVAGGTVSAGGEYVGGLIGYGGKIDRSISLPISIQGINYVGGLSGCLVSDGYIKNSISLVTAVVSSEYYAGRITSNTIGTFFDNYAWDKTLVNEYPVISTGGKNGCDISSSVLWNNQTWWEQRGFDFSSTWEMGTADKYKLPYLKGHPISYNTDHLKPDTPAQMITSIFLSGPTTLTMGTSGTFTAEIKDQNSQPISGETVIWSSSNTTVLEVDPNTGAYTAKADGTAVITATSVSKPSVKKTASVRVNSEPILQVITSVDITGPSTAMIGSTGKLAGVVKDQDGNPMTDEKISWFSSNEAMLEVVAATGEYHAKAAGSVTITAATMTKPEVKTTSTLTVSAPSGSYIAVDTSAYAKGIRAGEKVTVPVKAYGAERIQSLAMKGPSIISGVSVVLNTTTPLDTLGSWSKSEVYPDTGKFIWSTNDPSKGLSGNAVTLFYIDITPTNDVESPITLAVNVDDIYNLDDTEITANYPVIPGSLSIILISELQNTVSAGEWGATITAEIVSVLTPSNLDKLTAPIITNKKNSLQLTKVVVKKTVRGVQSEVPAKVLPNGLLEITDDISDASELEVTFTGNKLGDVTGDNKVNSLDKAKVSQHVADKKRLDIDGTFYGDITGDTNVNSLDNAKLGQYLAEKLNEHYQTA